MHVKEVRYEKLINLGNYENEKYSVTVLVNEGETVAQAFKVAKKEIFRQVYSKKVREMMKELKEEVKDFDPEFFDDIADEHISEIDKANDLNALQK